MHSEQESTELLQDKCPKCGSVNVDKLLCEDFLDDAAWEELTCKDCGNKWEEPA